jgi:hypothetical protein
MVQARQTQVTRVLYGSQQLRVPLYQRRYAWKDREWDYLWDDIAQLASDRKTVKAEMHFLGAVVLAKSPASATGSHDLLVIDGQQRLITISLLLCALRDSDFPLPNSVRQRISRCLLVDTKSQKLGPLKRLKVLPTQFDQDAFSRLINRQQHDMTERITEGYMHFQDRLTRLDKDNDESVGGISVLQFALTTLDGLECVYITAGPEDNVHRIFESLNNRGLPLTQFDLIRNYVFMRLSKNSEEFYEYTWKPLEKRFSAQELTQLFWLDLVRDRPSITQRQTYVEQQKQLHRLTGQSLLKGAIEKIAARGDLWELILHPEKEPSQKVRIRLQRLKEWDTTTVWPILMYLLQRRHDGSADSHQIARAMLYVESYFVRRVVVGRATDNMNRVLLGAPPALNEVLDTSVADALCRYLSPYGKHWATDDELRRDGPGGRFYNHGKAHQKTLILRWIEESLGDHEVSLADDLSIEHVMPQGLTPAWRAELRNGVGSAKDLIGLHAQLLHTLGNLTLTGRNNEMSNKSFEDKKKILAKYGSGLKMTQEVKGKKYWGPKEIRKRSDLMVERIIKAWPGPVST